MRVASKWFRREGCKHLYLWWWCRFRFTPRVVHEGGRRKTARLGGEVAGTRAGGIHRVGAYAQRERRRGVPVEWEAGDAKRSRAAGVAQRRDADGARRKADGTLDRRCKLDPWYHIPSPRTPTEAV